MQQQTVQRRVYRERHFHQPMRAEGPASPGLADLLSIQGRCRDKRRCVAGMCSKDLYFKRAGQLNRSTAAIHRMDQNLEHRRVIRWTRIKTTA